jgi:hypothetical protein
LEKLLDELHWHGIEDHQKDLHSIPDQRLRDEEGERGAAARKRALPNGNDIKPVSAISNEYYAHKLEATGSYNMSESTAV